MKYKSILFSLIFNCISVQIFCFPISINTNNYQGDYSIYHKENNVKIFDYYSLNGDSEIDLDANIVFYISIPYNEVSFKLIANGNIDNQSISNKDAINSFRKTIKFNTTKITFDASNYPGKYTASFYMDSYQYINGNANVKFYLINSLIYHIDFVARIGGPNSDSTSYFFFELDKNGKITQATDAYYKCSFNIIYNYKMKFISDEKVISTKSTAPNIKFTISGYDKIFNNGDKVNVIKGRLYTVNWYNDSNLFGKINVIPYECLP